MDKQFLYKLILLLCLTSGHVFGSGQLISLKTYVVNPAGDSILNAETVQQLTHLKAVFPNFRVTSFVFYISRVALHAEPVVNNGASFNNKVLYYLSRAREGALIVFDEIKALNKKDQVVSLQPLTIRVFSDTTTEK